MTEQSIKDEQINFQIQRIFAKDISFEVPNAPSIFQEEWKPNIQVDLNIDQHQLGEEVYEVVLKITVTSTHENKKTAFICEVSQAGIFSIGKTDDDKYLFILNVFCPNILFPYARETISTLINKGTFPQFNLSPVNFESIFKNQIQQQAQNQQSNTTLN